MFAGCFVLLATACDSDFSGETGQNQPPDTHLSVRDESLVDNLDEDTRLLSTIQVSWTGDDEDGFVKGYEVRFYPESSETTVTDWTFTARNDSLFLLPIPPGSQIANVIFEVRAIDDDDEADPTPARTIFPIRNSPPQIRLSLFEQPPDTTFEVVSFVWSATDPDGPENLKAVSISLNDSTSFIDIDPEYDFITLAADPFQLEGIVEARLFLGRGIEPSVVRVPGMILNGENTFYVRTVDFADTTSAIARHTWFVKAQQSDVLYVNDYRLPSENVMRSYHVGLLEEYLQPSKSVDYWDISKPFAIGSSGSVGRSSAVPTVTEPMIRLTLGRFRYIYWMSSSTIGDFGLDNMPAIAPVMTDFFNNDGKLMVLSPTSVSSIEEEFGDNPAVLLLPLSQPLVLPDSLARLELQNNSEIALTPTGVILGLPTLKSKRFFINIRPYFTDGANIDPLYEGNFVYRARSGGQGVWSSPTTLASISSDRRIALFTLPVVNDTNGEIQFVGEDDNPDAAKEAIHAILQALGFPQ